MPYPIRSGDARRSTRRPVLSAALLALVIAGVACEDSSRPTPTAPNLQPGFSSSVSQDPAPDPMDVAKVVPGFGGYFLGNGVPTVHLTDPSRRPEAEEALAGFLADRGFTAEDLQVRQASYDWLQLDAWHEQAWPQALAVPGAVYSDIDEGSNRLRFGGVDASAVQGILSVLASLGIPGDASVVEQTAPIEQMHTLRDRVRPVHGGYQINFLDVEGVRTLSFLCTLGFNAVKDGVSSFITNSHCTNHQGGTETPTDYYQPLIDPDGDRLANPENFIGVEVDDPHYDAVSCAEVQPGAVCRYSDAARAEYAADVPFQLGRIARTTQGYQDTPTTTDVLGQPVRQPVLDVDPNNPSFSINSEQKRSVLGETANKVGRTTGWTFGPVIQTCINTLVLGTVPPVVQRCQDRVRADVAGGDSGSPVFRRRGNGGNVSLLGILWGGSVSGTVTYVFSPMANIHRELGEFRTH